MVQEMTQFSSQTLPYDPSYVLPHFKSEHHHHPFATTPWESPEVPTYGTQNNSAGLFEGCSGPATEASAPSAPKGGAKKPRKGGGKGSYKHVPHREKPPHLVARRNARERRRVQAVNTAFSRLRKCVPAENRNKRLSKVKTLHRAIEYIQMLQEMLSGADDQLMGTTPSSLLINKENELNQRWMMPSEEDWEEENQNSCLSFYDDFADPMQS